MKLIQNNEQKKSLFSIKWLLALFLIVILLSLLALPTIASTSWGNAQILKFLNDNNLRTIRAKKMSFSWLGPQKMIEGEVNDFQNHTHLIFEQASLNCSLLQLFWKQCPAGNLNLSSLQAQVLKKSHDSNEELKIELKDVNAMVTFDSPEKPLTLHLTGFTEQKGLPGEFEIDVELAGLETRRLLALNREAFDFFQSKPNAALNVQADVSNFPTTLLDHFLIYFRPELAGFIEPLLGESLNFKIDQQVTKDQINFTLHAKSSHLLASIKAVLTPTNLSLQEPGKIQFKFSSEMLSKVGNFPLQWSPIQPFEADMTIDQLYLPIQSLKESKKLAIDLNEAVFSASLTLPKSDSVLSEEKIAFKQLQATFKKEAKSRAVSFTADGEAVLGGESTTFQLPPVYWEIGEQVTLLQPAVLQVNLGPSLFNYLFPDQLVKLQSRSSLDVIFQKISFPLKEFSPEAVKFQAEARFAPLQLRLVSFIQDIILNGLRIEMTGESLKDAKVLLRSALAQPEDKGELVTLLGSRTSLYGEGHVSLSQDGHFVFKDFKAKLKSHLAEVDLEGEIVENRAFYLTVPATINYILHPQAMEQWGIKQTHFLAKDTPIEMTVQTPREPLDFSHLKTLNLKGSIHINELILVNKKESAATLQKTSLFWEIDGANNRIETKFNGRTYLGVKNIPGEVQGSFSIQNWIRENKFNFREASYQLKTNLNKLPIALINPISTQLDLLPVLGSSIDLFADANLNLAQSKEGILKEGILKVKLHSNQVKGEANFKIKESLTLEESTSPATISFTLTPAGYKAIRKHFLKDSSYEMNLITPAEVVVKLKEVNIPLHPEGDFFLPYWQGSVSSDFTIDHLEAYSPQESKRISLKNIKGSLISENLSEQLQWALQLENALEITGGLEKGFTKEGMLNSEGLFVTIDTKLDEFPAELLCHLVCLHPSLGKKAQALLGDKVSGFIQVKLRQMNGPILANLKGGNGSLFLDGFLVKNYLTLNKPLNINVNVTPQLSQYILQDYFPLFAGITAANQPFKIVVEPKGFSLPLFPLSISSAQVSQATIDMGHVHFTPQSQLGTVITLLALTKRDYLSVWLTPIYFSLSKGTLRLERVDMLVGNEYPIAAWGKVNLVKDKVNMVIALSGLAISKAFNVSIAQKNHYLQLPLKGTLQTASIDKAKATTRISALVAQSQGSPHGFLIGTFLDIAGGSLNEEKAPAPTTNPLPWSSLFEDDSKTFKEDNGKDH